jgi:hypothetical protein
MRRMQTISGSEEDSATMADLFSFPGADTRQWVSYGIVDDDVQGGDHAVRFTDDSNNPLPQGVLVTVKLQPSGITVVCRVGMHAAGVGEGEYSPFSPGDEVVVAIPEGNERAGCVILCRLTNSYDVFPTTVAANDVTQNNISFKRTLTPFIHESGGTYTIRSASTGATLSLGIQAPASNPTALSGVALGDGLGNQILLTPSAIMINQEGGTNLSLGATTSGLSTSGTFSVFTTSTVGLGTAVGVHAIGLEQVCMLIEGFMTTWGLALAAAVPIFGIGAMIAATLTPATLPAFMAGGITVGSVLPLTIEKGAIITALTTIPANPATPNVGCLGFTFR